MENRIIPTLRYSDPNKAVAWLCEHLGFSIHVAHPSDGARIIHAQLVRGNDMIMLGGTRDDEFSRNMILASEMDGKNTQSPYIIVEDVRSMYEDCLAKGVDIALEFKAEEYGGESFSCRDPEGNLWNIGSYNPWA